MADTLKGKLTFTGDGSARTYHLVFTTRKGGIWKSHIHREKLALDLRDSKETEVAVELETDPKGQPYRVRRDGQPRVEAPAGPPPPQPPPSKSGRDTIYERGGGGRQGRPQLSSKPIEALPSLAPAFHNPYNFVPAPPRDEERVRQSGLGDEEPAGHDRYDPELCIPDACV